MRSMCWWLVVEPQASRPSRPQARPISARCMMCRHKRSSVIECGLDKLCNLPCPESSLFPSACWYRRRGCGECILLQSDVRVSDLGEREQESLQLPRMMSAAVCIGTSPLAALLVGSFGCSCTVWCFVRRLCTSTDSGQSAVVYYLLYRAKLRCVYLHFAA